MTISETMHQVWQTSDSKGWHEGSKRTFGDYIALMHSELSEALEEFRSGHSPTEIYYPHKAPKPEGIPIELADLVIRVFEYCYQENIDLEAAIIIKDTFNQTRPHRHGDKKI